MGFFEDVNIYYLLFILLVVIFIVREIATWYWKINRIVHVLELQNEMLKQIANKILKD